MAADAPAERRLQHRQRQGQIPGQLGRAAIQARGDHGQDRGQHHRGRGQTRREAGRARICLQAVFAALRPSRGRRQGQDRVQTLLGRRALHLMSQTGKLSAREIAINQFENEYVCENHS